ncbi:hypothetical protein LCGC14_0565180 [marine sediment metagenome]|uniref:Uncharacterized protein n=1 Tax=marine sediment metagenome TaxID=412755 RepID=A0A0F9UU30_9ZZZZ
MDSYKIMLMLVLFYRVVWLLNAFLLSSLRYRFLVTEQV